MKNNQYLFPLFWIGLILTTYLEMGEYYIIGMFVLIGLISIIKNNGRACAYKKCSFFYFVMYYIFVSVIGIFTGYVSFKNFAEFLLKYIVLPVTIFELIPNRNDRQIEMLKILKFFIFVTCLYGLIESIVKYNLMTSFVRLDTRVWMESMNGAANYQPCAIFLHYNYYGCVLILGLVFAWLLPYRVKFWNVIYWIVLLEQILICQSRICWIASIVLLMIRIGKGKRITNTAVKKGLLLIALCTCVLIFKPDILTTISNFVRNRFSRLWVYGFKDGSLGQRLGTLMNWPYYFQLNTVKGLVGTGYQSIMVYYMKKYSFFKGYSTADCQLTVYLVETGIIGVLILGVTLIIYFKRKKSHCLDGKTISEISKMALMAFCVECMTLDIISNNIILSLILMLIIISDKQQVNGNRLYFSKDKAITIKGTYIINEQKRKSE